MLMKKIICLSVATAFITMSFNTTIFAKDTAALKEDTSENIYQEHGQIIVDNLSFIYEDEQLSYYPKTRSQSSLEQKNELDKIIDDEIISKDVLESLYFDAKNHNRELVAVGYTNTYVKNSAENDLLRANGVQTKGGLTLTVGVSIDNWDRTQAAATAIADWKLVGPLINDEINPTPKTTDFMTISLAENFSLMSSSLSGNGYSNGYQKEKERGTAIYGFKETVGRTAINSTGHENYSPTVTRQWTAKYVHTWKELTPSFNIYNGGVNISIEDNSFQIAAWVNY